MTYRQPQRVLVLGAGGFIGNHLIVALRRHNISVLAATRRPLRLHPDVENVVDAYVASAAFDPLLEHCDAVIHAASHSTPGSSMATPLLDGDLRTTLSLLEALQRHPGRRLMFLSSAGTLYGDRTTPAREDDPLKPRSYHGAGKAAAEHFIQAWSAQHGGAAIIVRPSNVYGQGQMPRHGFAVIPTAMRCALEGRVFDIYGDGSQVRDYLHVDDLVRFCLTALGHPTGPGTHVFNAASSTPTSLHTLLEMIESTSGLRIQRRHMPERPADVHTILLNAAAAHAALGWAPNVHLSEGIHATWDWFRTQA